MVLNEASYRSQRFQREVGLSSTSAGVSASNDRPFRVPTSPTPCYSGQAPPTTLVVRALV
jgi:hypothetical protein